MNQPSFNQLSSYEKLKLSNAICFFAKKHKERTGKVLYQTYLYKYLAFLDKFSVEEYGQPAFNLTYMAMERGPVPLELYSERNKLKTGFFEFKEDFDSKFENNFQVITYEKPDLDLFTDFELSVMNRLIMKYANDYATTNIISEDSHREIKSWERAYSEKINSIMDYRNELAIVSGTPTIQQESLSFSKAFNDYFRE